MATLPFRPNIVPADPLRDWRKAITVHALAAVTSRDITQTAKQLYGEGAETVLKAAVPITTTSSVSALATSITGAFMESLRPASAASDLFRRGATFDLRGAVSISLPRWNADFAVGYVGEGGAMPVVRATATTGITLVPKKLAVATVLTNELIRYTADVAEQVVTTAIVQATGRALDSRLFSTAAADATGPAGILNGIAASTAATGGGVSALVADLRTMTAAVQAAGGGASLVIFAALPQFVSIQVLAGDLEIPVVAAPSLAAGTVILMDVGAFATAFGADPKITTAEAAVLHLEDTTPTDIGTRPTGAQTASQIAAPVRSAFQSDLKAIRVTLDMAYAMRAPALAFVTGATW